MQSQHLGAKQFTSLGLLLALAIGCGKKEPAARPEPAVPVAASKPLLTPTDEECRQLARKLEQEYAAEYLHPYIAAAVGYVDEVIDPRDTRPKLISGLAMLRNKAVDRPRRKHGNIPL